MNPRLRRLQADYELVREVFSGHPHVVVEPAGAHLPPESYRITFRLRGLFLNGEQPAYREIHHVELMLPRAYPAERPYVVPVEPIFHPNIRDYFCIADYWAAGTTLADVIAKLGDMIQWRIYNVASPLDAIAARWASEQEPSGLFPVGNVDLGVADFEVSVRSRSPEHHTQELAPLALDEAQAGHESGGDSPPQSGGNEAAEQPQADEEELVVLLRAQER